MIPKWVVLDFECVVTEGNKFVIKEIAFHKQYGEIGVQVFEPLVPWNFLDKYDKIINSYLHKERHGIDYEFGNHPQIYVASWIRSKVHECELIFVKGVEKCDLIQSIVKEKPVLNLDKYNCPELTPYMFKKYYRLSISEHHCCPFEWHAKDQPEERLVHCPARTCLLYAKFVQNMQYGED